MSRPLWILSAAAVAMAISLEACGTAPAPEPAVRIVEKAIPTPAPCVSDATPAPPAFPDTDDALRAATPGQRYVLIARGRLMRIQRLMEIEPLIQACRK